MSFRRPSKQRKLSWRHAKRRKKGFLQLDVPKFTIYIDSWCPLCKRAGRFVGILDFLDLVRVEDIRRSEVPSEEFCEKGLSSLASITPKGGHFFGFDTLLMISLRLPLFWILLPVMFLLKWTGAGSYLYNELAVKRTIIPLHCGDSCGDSYGETCNEALDQP